MDDFFRTRMGHRFFESTMPKVAEELARLNTNIEALIALLERRSVPEHEGDDRDADQDHERR